MRKIKIILFIFLVFSSLLSGCVALDLRQANHELADLYRAKSEAINSSQWEQELSVNEALSILASEAAAEGADRLNSEVNRISFYRIAATAAWQAGDAKVVAYANEGRKLCTSENYQKTPRDCGMLSVIPGFASVDELTKKIDDIQKRLRSGSNPPTVQEIVTVFDDIKSRINNLLKNRNAIKQSNAHPKLIDEIDKQTGIILCQHIHNVRGLILEIAGSQSAAYKEAQCEDFKLQVKLKELGFAQQIAPCLPPGIPKDPGGCQ